MSEEGTVGGRGSGVGSRGSGVRDQGSGVGGEERERLMVDGEQ